MNRIFALLLALGVMGCQEPRRSDLVQLDRMKSQVDWRINAAETISCEATDLICVQLLVARGSACLQLTEDAEGAAARQRRQCSLDDFAAAQRQLPNQAPAQDRRAVLTGLASARKVTRDNTLDMAAAAALNEQITSGLPGLQTVPGGAPYAAYFASDAEAYRAQRGVMPSAESCRMLGAARSGLPGAAVPSDLARRVLLLRTAIDASMLSRSCA